MEDVNILRGMANLTRLVYSTGSSVFWIGLYDDVNSWRWSMSDPNFYQHEENQFRNWEAGEPNNEFGIEFCGRISLNGLWNDVPCSGKLNAVCFNVSGTTPWFYNTSSSMSWTQAQSYCREHHTDLASVRHMSDNQVIKNLITKPVWIGLYRDSWKWVDGRNSSYRYWNTGEPNNNNGKGECAAANFGQAGKWEDWSCGWKKAFICYAAPRSHQVIKLKLEFSSSLARDNSTALKDLLKKLKQKLKDDGVKGDIKLSWRKHLDGEVFQKQRKKDEL
ncbi:macrophage mannose receptor 1-like [Girardinichthys multiradiatus]|uniref:macrophage mannose receptor 1-like n=1 Tax=Girardinichthys multiradiatus TaxID=208333 RepID=UPI001FABD6BE|nr:macrophage mannose receptor 1-like [Girardinichthys multiradiatus]